jgi:transcriptional regulator with XRE-family HTH domain
MSGMSAPRSSAQARRAAERTHRSLGEDLRRLRADAGLSLRALAVAAGVDPAFLGRIEDGVARASIETYARLSVALGADLAARLYPTTGPTIRDRHQARILEALLGQLHHRWRAYPEVAVRHPARGWIDMVLHESTVGIVLAVEIQSQLSRLEQLIRWSGEKAVSLPSWEGFAQLGPVTVSKVLIVRSTRTTREIGQEFGRQLEVAYPAHPEDALASLTGQRPWPGDAQLWVDLGPRGVRFMTRRAAAHAIIRTT